MEENQRKIEEAQQKAVSGSIYSCYLEYKVNGPFTLQVVYPAVRGLLGEEIRLLGCLISSKICSIHEV